MNFNVLIGLFTILLLSGMALLFLHFRRKEFNRNITQPENDNRGSFAGNIIKLILAHRANIREIKNLDIIKMTAYTQGNLARLTSLISEGKFAELELFEPTRDTLGSEELSVVKFLDQESNVYLGLVYDNAMLLQATRLLWIYPV
ncbi:MAG TPA: hypothetical protein VNZ86_19220 [Bacteroidia bacterium]|jgi:hypothetical protein|nr:hypothetical protein [Bacteroidia bacterium]